MILKGHSKRHITIYSRCQPSLFNFIFHILESFSHRVAGKIYVGTGYFAVQLPQMKDNNFGFNDNGRCSDNR